MHFHDFINRHVLSDTRTVVLPSARHKTPPFCSLSTRRYDRPPREPTWCRPVQGPSRDQIPAKKFPPSLRATAPELRLLQPEHPHAGRRVGQLSGGGDLLPPHEQPPAAGPLPSRLHRPGGGTVCRITPYTQLNHPVHNLTAGGMRGHRRGGPAVPAAREAPTVGVSKILSVCL